MNLCPECRNGKCVNCTDEALYPNDRVGPCECPSCHPVDDEPDTLLGVVDGVPEMDLPGTWSTSDFEGEFRGGVDHG